MVSAKGMALESDGDIATGLCRVHGCRDSAGRCPDRHPVIGFQHDKGDLTPGQALLIPNSLIASHHDLVVRLFGGGGQSIVDEASPTDLGCCIDSG